MSISVDSAIAEFLREKLAEAAPPAFYDVDRCEFVSGNAARAAHRRGELRLFRVGKKLLADATELHAWIRRHEVPRRPVATDAELDELDQVLASAGVERAR